MAVIENVQSYLAVAAGGAAVGTALWAAGRYLPGLLVARLKMGFLRARSSGWLTDPRRPKRLRAYLGFLEWAEDEVPDRGDPAADAWFLAAGVWIVEHLPPKVSGRASAWAAALRAISDEADDGFDAELAELRRLSREGAE